MALDKSTIIIHPQMVWRRNQDGSVIHTREYERGTMNSTECGGTVEFDDDIAECQKCRVMWQVSAHYRKLRNGLASATEPWRL